jgi:putative ABC transport system permease protein
MRTPMVSGRAFDTTDGPGAPPVTVINDTMARQFFPGEDAVGRTLVLDWETVVHVRVVGVSADVTETGLDSAQVPTFFLPQRWYPRTTMHLVIRTSTDPIASAGAVRQAIRDVDDDISIAEVQTMDARLANSIFQPKFQSVLVGLFALVALALSAVGLYGVLALFVRQRGHEISVRLALGADVGHVVRLVLGQGARLVGAGLLIGLAGGLAGSTLLQSALVGVGPADPLTYVGVSLSLATVGVAACLVPALRAARLDPAEALKAE